MKRKRRPKIQCEICGNRNKIILHRHHIIPKVDARCTNLDTNLAIVCPNCHASVHSGIIIIIGIYQTTNGVELFWFNKGETPPLQEKYWIIKNNPLVITVLGEEDDLPEEE